MRLCRLSLIVVVFFIQSVMAIAQQTYSSATVGQKGSNSNLCAHTQELNNAITEATCGGVLTDPTGHSSGAGSAAAAASFSVLEVGGTVEVSNDGQGPEAQMGISAQANMSDYFTVQGYTGEAYLLSVWSLVATPHGTAEAGISETVDLSSGTKGGTCQILTFGSNSCSAEVALTPGEEVYMSVTLGASASVSCTPPLCGGAGSMFYAGIGKPGGGTPLLINVVDGNGNLISGVSITSASGHKYPAKYASQTTLTSSVNPSTTGELVTFTATVTSFGRSSPVGGTVTFKDTSTGTTLGRVTVQGGAASYATSALTTGTHAITATYGGDAWSRASQSAVLNQVVE